MTGRDPITSTAGGIMVEDDPELLGEVVEEELELLIEDDIEDLSAPAAAPARDRRAMPIALAQGLVYVAAGLWPIVHLRSFEAVTGRKRETWLVKTVGLLISAIGATLLTGSRNRASHGPLRVLGATSAAALGGVALYYAARRRIAPIYFADGAMELAFFTSWLARRA